MYGWQRCNAYCNEKILHREQDVGVLKADSAKEKLARENSAISSSLTSMTHMRVSISLMKSYFGHLNFIKLKNNYIFLRIEKIESLLDDLFSFFCSL
jgi:hypothetical protein